jgi:RNA polymerase sigma-70 factor (ECF subfamily)
MRENLELCPTVARNNCDEHRIIRMKPEENLPDNELLQLMRAGDEEAFTLLYRRRQAAIYRFAVQMGGSPALAEDVTQEVFLALIRECHAFDPGRGSLSAFLFGMARNQLLRRLQRERFYAQIDDDAKEDGASALVEPWEDFLRAEAIESVRKAVLSLPERYREVVVLCDLEEMSYIETAEILGCALGTVRSRLHRGRSLLIEKLRPTNDQQPAKAARCFA